MKSGEGEDGRDSGVVIAGPHAPTITPINTPTDALTDAAGQTRRAVKLAAPPPPMTPLLAALLGAINPFLLWYGREARPYALWAVLAVPPPTCC